MPTTTRAALYARVSTEDQTEGYSIDQQLDAMRQFCQAKGWTVAAEYIEPGASGTTRDRPAFQDALSAAEAGRYDVLVVHQLDRFYRNLRLQLETLSQLGEWQVGFYSVTEQIDYTTPQGMLFLSMLGAFNEYYAANLAREVRKGKHGRARAGLSNAPHLPLGYERTDDGQAVPDPDAAPTVQRIFELYATGQYGYQGLADHLNAQGVPVLPRSRTRLWQFGIFRTMLANRFYIGEVPHKGQWYAGQHEALIDRALFEQVQVVRRRRAKRHTPRARHPVLLRGILYCAHCGNLFYSSPKPHGTYYVDSDSRKERRCPAPNHVRADPYDAQMGELVQRIRLPRDWQERIEDLATRRQDHDQAAHERARLERALGNLQKQHQWGHLDDDAYLHERAALTARLAQVQPPAPSTLEQAALSLETLRDTWQEADTQTRHEMLAIIFEKVIIDTEQGRLVAVVPWPEFAPLFRLDGLEERQDGTFYLGLERAAK